MIIINIFGGLGNQMFQYAFGKALSLKYNRELFIDKSYFDEENYPYDLHPTHYPYKLDLYNIHDEFSPGWISKYQKLVARKRLYNLSNPIVYIFNNIYPIYFNKKNFDFEKLEKTKYAYLDGYWQNYDIIESFADEIQNSFELIDISEKAKKVLKEIQTSNSVSMHFRKGDYLSNPKFKSIYAHCTTDYYNNAMNIMDNAIDNPKYFIFSDNMDWVKNNLNIIDDMYIINDDIIDHEQQYLMSHCQHNIIANSSFSWWGAWLNSKTDKNVIALENWFLLKSRKNDIYYPKTWSTIGNG